MAEIRREEEVKRQSSGTGTASRLAAYKAVYRATRDHRAACAAYCAGNRWLEENARAVGNIR